MRGGGPRGRAAGRGARGAPLTRPTRGRRAGCTGRRASMRASTMRPTSSAGAGQVDELVLARAAEQADDTGRQRPAEGVLPRQRQGRPGRLVGASSSWSCARGRATASTSTDARLPSHSRLRSRPIPSWTASRRVEPLALDGRRDVVGEARGRRARARRVGRREDLVVADGLEQAERRLELGLGLAAEADDDVGARWRSRGRPRGSAPGARGSARSCTGGPSAAGPRRRPTGPAGGGARRRDGQSAMAAISRSDRSHGCEVTKRRRGMAGRAVVAAERRRWPGSARRGPDDRARSSRRPAQRSLADVGEARLGRQVVAVAS